MQAMRKKARDDQEARSKTLQAMFPRHGPGNRIQEIQLR